jgi:hypothetical protein
MTRQRRHPAQASRILAAGLSAATMLGIVAALGAAPVAGTPAGPPAVAPSKAAVVVRVPATGSARRREQPPQAAQTPDTSTRPS